MLPLLCSGNSKNVRHSNICFSLIDFVWSQSFYLHIFKKKVSFKRSINLLGFFLIQWFYFFLLYNLAFPDNVVIFKAVLSFGMRPQKRVIHRASNDLFSCRSLTITSEVTFRSNLDLRVGRKWCYFLYRFSSGCELSRLCAPCSPLKAWSIIGLLSQLGDSFTETWYVVYS